MPYQKALKTKKFLWDIVDLLELFNIKYCLGWGTLLGIVRQDELIKDDDIDINVFEAFWNQHLLWGRFLTELENLNYCVKDALYNYVCVISNDPKLSDVHLDLHLHEKAEGEYFYKGKGMRFYFPASFYDTLDTISFKDRTFTVPHSPEKLLAYMYGDDWTTPKSGEVDYKHYEKIDNYKEFKYEFYVYTHS
jgi:phosphorylcholine metabolism protein LicD